MYHSITFIKGNEQANTWEDWHLIPSSRPTLSPPGVQTNFVSIPGRMGALDFSEYLTGDVQYSDRSGSFEFLVDNDHEYWVSIKNKIVDFLHGNVMKMVLEDDPEYYYEGRFTVDSWKSESWNSKIVINYVVGADKKHLY